MELVEQRLTGESEANANESETEAGAGCTTPECLGIAGIVGSPDLEVAELCRSSLPEHCQQIKNIKFTVCYEDQAGLGKSSVISGGYCLLGIWEGLVDVGTGVVKLGKGTYKFAVDEEYREEALNTGSVFFEQFSDSEKFKALLSGSILAEMDEFVECLNYRGRWEYICEGGIQVIAPLYGYKKVKQFIGGRRNKQKLSVREKFEQRKELQELLSGTGYVDIGKLSSYQLGRLKPKDMRRMEISNFTDDIGSFLSNRQLHSIPPSKMNKLDIRVNHRTLRRLSDEQFKVAMINGDITSLPFNVIEGNIKRIRSVDVPRLSQLSHISPKAFSQMSAVQIRGMSSRQVNNVTPEQRASLSSRKKKAFEETREKRKQPEATTGETVGTPASGSSTGGAAKLGAKKPKDSKPSER